MPKQSNDYKHLHSEACSRGDESYVDPESEHTVFTEIYHTARGHCCDSGCRHCPYAKKSKLENSNKDEQVK